jgi:DNA-directed RNA polymerase subunit beta'
MKQSFHPRNFIGNVICVSPNNTRPETKKHGNSNSHSDDTTKTYQMLIETNKKIAELINKLDQLDNQKKFDILIETFDNMHYQLILGNLDSDAINKFKASNNKPLQSICERLKGKEGDIKKGTMGKKVDKMFPWALSL